MLRGWTILVAAALGLAACSGSGDGSGSATTPPPTTDPAAADDGSAALSAGETAPDGTSSEVVPQWSVTIDVAADGFGGAAVDTSVGWTGDPNDVVDDGPFGRFASCSGLRDRVGAYSVFVSAGDGDGGGAEDGGLDAVGVWTAARVTGAGIYDAEVRIEPSGGATALTASGTMTILDDLRTGEFLAFGADGGRVEGTFSCSGSDGPTPLRAGAEAAIEVFAILRADGAERIVALATEPGEAATCDPGGAQLLLVEGDATFGSITAIEIDGEPTPAMRMRVAGTEYDFDDVVLSVDESPSGASGAFSATADGVSVDGAFTCT